MLEKLSASLGHALRGARAGTAGLVINDGAFAGVAASIDVKSPAFEDGAELPETYTADGEGVSPPLDWHGVPTGAAAVVLLVEDADSPTPHPLVHAIAWDLPGGDGSLPQGALPSAAGVGGGLAMGRNSYFMAKYLAPDPPPGHGPHRYVFEFFALDAPPKFDGPPGRTKLVEALRGHVLGKGMLTGTYKRD